VATALGWIVLGLPLLGCLILSLWPGEPPKPVTRAVGCGSIGAAFALTLAVWAGLLSSAADDRVHVSSLWEWIQIGGLRIDLAIRIDQLSVMMMLVITGVGLLIHVYSTGYMDHEEGYRRFFSQMNFFVFSMLLLVEAGNFLFLIVGWAFVGIASYLLIGFYYQRPSAVAAAKKAFVVNVIGDVGMIIAAFLLIREIGSLDYGAVFALAPERLGSGSGAAEAVGLLLFVGAAAKSAQIPLHTWLPDAMEGPTPVSALIHAATMVTAGVYLVVRCHVLYALAPDASDVVAIVGMVTLFLAATIATVQLDIKRVLAWSTVSQIGYMIMAAGLGAYSAAMFHFLTHAFFKALLFLSAGIVIHALADEQSLDRYGGLRRPLRFAYLAFGVGCLAIAGVPGFSGFFSKDDILATSFEAGALGKVCWVVGTLAAGITAFYMFRALLRAFWGSEPAEGWPARPHPSGLAMSVPVALLAVGAAVIGWIQVPGGWSLVSDWLEPVLATPLQPTLEATTTSEVLTGICSTAMAAAGIGLAWWLFAADPGRRLRLAGVARGPRGVLRDAYRVDEVYDEAFVVPGRDLGDVLRDEVEPYGPGGLVTAAVDVARDSARGLSALQTGLVRTYAFAVVGGLVLVGVVFILVIR
jgi:NADH-quinone oxidoreductase subunit L